MEVQFKAYRKDFVRNEYKTSSDRHKLSDEELKEVLSYKDITEKFEYCDWFGGSTSVKATLVKVEETQYHDLLFTIELNRNIPEHYCPSPSDILKGKGLLFPISYSRH